MASDASTSAVWMALIGNAFLTVVKFIAFTFSGSGAMFSEAVHSFADTANQALLAIGIKRSQRPADTLFPYGFGGERYLFALLSAVGIFVLGCGVTLYHGVEMLMHPPELDIRWYVFAVLAVSLVVDGFVMAKAIEAVHQVRGERSFMQYLRGSTDPTVAAVLLEDGVACLGVIVAMVAIGLSAATGSTLPDAIATLIIGGMMGGVAIWLGLKNRTLIIGRSIPAPLQAKILAFLGEQPSVERVRNVRSVVVGAKVFKFTADVDWDGRVLAEPLIGWVEQRSSVLATPDERAGFARDFGEQLARQLALEIDRIEAELKARFPELAFLDFESD